MNVYEVKIQHRFNRTRANGKLKFFFHHISAESVTQAKEKAREIHGPMADIMEITMRRERTDREIADELHAQGVPLAKIEAFIAERRNQRGAR